jgi:hypothetical protein
VFEGVGASREGGEGANVGERLMFRGVGASREGGEGADVGERRVFDRPSVRRMVGNLFFFKCQKWTIFFMKIIGAVQL